MPSRFIISGAEEKDLEAYVSKVVISTGSTALGLAVAYVSVYGAEFLRKLVARGRIENVRLVSEIGDAITHPKALKGRLDDGWEIRVVKSDAGIFHPKLIVGGSEYSADDLLRETRFATVGSANLTRGGLKGNVECSLITTTDGDLPAASRAFRALWQKGEMLSRALLATYEKEFATRNRGRSARDLKTLGVADEVNLVAGAVDLRQHNAPKKSQRSIDTTAAAAAWAGLESFTGEYRFQIEFPRDAGEVLGQIIAAIGAGPEIDVLCDDGEVRKMRFRYYPDNAMFRLNVPNDTPGIEWARENKTGIALVSTSDTAAAPLRLEVLRPGIEANDVIGRSAGLGTWGKTRTRLYGWF